MNRRLLFALALLLLAGALFCWGLPPEPITVYEARTVYLPAWIDVRACGAIGDAVRDDTGALQAALDQAASSSGGKVYLPPGTYRTTAPLRITGRDTVLVADYRRRWVGARPPPTQWSGATILADHEGPAIELQTADPINGCRIEHISLVRAGDGQAGRSGIGIRIRHNGPFRGMLWLDDLALIGFETGILFDRPDLASIKQIGMVRITRCSFRLNDSALEMRDATQINRLFFVGNAVKFCNHGLRIGCNGAVITDNVFESLDDGLHVRSSYDVEIFSNYLGNIRDDYAIRLEQVHGGRLAWHRLFKVPAEPIQLRSCSRMRVVGPAALEGNCQKLDHIGTDWR